MKIILIAAIDMNYAIGVDNKLPWNLPDDLKHFRSLTKGYPVIMGRKTYESIGRPLPERLNLILSRQKKFSASGCVTCDSLEQALSEAKKTNPEKCFVIGGEAIFEMALPLADCLEITWVHTKIPRADAYFPKWNEKDWKMSSNAMHKVDSAHIYPFEFQTYVRK